MARMLELRRHTDNDGDVLTEEGVAAALRVGAGLEVTGSPWGPLLGGSRSWAGCRLAGSTPTGYAELVEGVIERLELHDGEPPLGWLHGRYVSVGELDERG